MKFRITTRSAPDGAVHYRVQVKNYKWWWIFWLDAYSLRDVGHGVWVSVLSTAQMQIQEVIAQRHKRPPKITYKHKVIEYDPQTGLHE